MFGEGNYEMGSGGKFVLRSKLMGNKEFMDKMRQSEAGKEAGVPVGCKEEQGGRMRICG